MRIDTVNIHVYPGARPAGARPPVPRDPQPIPQVGGTTANGEAPAAPDRADRYSLATPTRIGEAWQGGIYAGISRGEDGEPDAHLVLLRNLHIDDLTWQQAVDWAAGLGDGARLPTRFQSALLYANLRDQLDTDRWHWTGTQYSDDGAWSQGFNNGFQYYYGKKSQARARAVRRFPL